MPFITIALALAVMGLFASAICEKWASFKVCKTVGLTFLALSLAFFILTILTI